MAISVWQAKGSDTWTTSLTSQDLSMWDTLEPGKQFGWQHGVMWREQSPSIPPSVCLFQCWNFKKSKMLLILYKQEAPVSHSHFLNKSCVLIPGSLLEEHFDRSNQCCGWGGCELKHYTCIYYIVMYVSIHYAGVT